MSVLFFSGSFAPTGGIETFTANLMAGLASRGIETQLLCWGRPRNAVLRRLQQASVPVHRQGWRWGCHWYWPDRLLLARHRSAIAAASAIVFGKPVAPVVHRAIAAMGPKRPRSILITPYRPAEVWRRHLPGLRCLHSLHRIVDTFDEIAVQAPSFEDDLRQFGYTGRVTVLPYLPPIAAATVAPPPDGPVRIGFLGRLVPQKNLCLLVRAFGLVVEHVEAELHLFGDGPEAAPLSRLAAALKLSGKVHFHGSIPTDRVEAAIDSCHLFAFTSVTEGQCLAALEVLARGRPVLATPVGAFPEILAEPVFGLLAPVAEPAPYAEALARLAQAAQAGQIGNVTIRDRYRALYPYDSILDGYCALLRDGEGPLERGVS
jgi:glycosyltransferase involved in cell wall biosynthesis